MFQSGIDKAGYPEVAVSATKAFGVAGELALKIESTPSAAHELSLAVWTMAHGFATLASEAALSRVGGNETDSIAKNLVLRLLPGFRAQQD